MKLYDDNGHEVKNPVTLRALKALEGIIADLEKPEHEPDYSDIEVYDDDGVRVTNVATLRAIAEAREIAAERRRRWEAMNDAADKKVS
ncbi:MAG: hypothetical protein IJG51_10800 [Synergistaceae bacterium]|nr:hypothetical protein [Synergistaceae bacterium]MBQ3346919.1 hypothetical protein [Synergistaceae bacterium]MBQ3399366.1 hypothetical protein [Synergistaceae bacterium]MBQ3759020.1 hypothetical protein [Synergistaceae bacterium]MBQ4402097.1 hypothetical protein [Synergistaceae bacterium]